eukprot:TRINITY_DN242_c0_g1_i1.p1 TRINITY_DN242_c0_g1~~TRINITY_DN242_c0_g1_i1.p1  ORF type:complete len:510 (-),score=121.11 TRINITY_DN242_c0_g1_i1:108-1637(-)
MTPMNVQTNQAAAKLHAASLDTRSCCIIVAAVLCAVLPLEIHHLVAALIGAIGYTLIQSLQPSIQRRPRKTAKLSKKTAPLKTEKTEKTETSEASAPWRAPSLQDGGKRWSSDQGVKRTEVASTPNPTASMPPSKIEMRKPSAVPVQAPTFQATGWDAEIEELLQRLMPTKQSEAAVEAIARAVQRLLQPTLPDAKVAAFASANPVSSHAFGVAVPEVDVVVSTCGAASSGRSSGMQVKNGDVGKLQKSLIRNCTDRLVSNGAFKFRRSAFRGLEPKVTLIAPAVGLHGLDSTAAQIPINLSVNATNPARCATLLEGCERFSPDAKALILLVRRWAKDRGVSHAAKGHLSPYCWTLLAIYYLQVGLEDMGGSVLPPLASLMKSGTKPEPVKQSSKTVAELFKGFFKFYTQHFDWRKEAVSVRLGKRSPPDASLPVHIMLQTDGKTTQIGPNVEEPFDGAVNLADGMNCISFSRLTEELLRSHELCGSGSSLAVLLEPWAPIEQDEQDRD